MKDLILIDGNPLFFKNFYIHNQRKTYFANNPVLVGFLQSLNKLKSIYNFNPHNVVITFDKGKSKFRKRILKSYKAQRKEQRKKSNFDWNLYIKQFNEVLSVIKHIYPVIIIDNYEGDDIISYYSLINNKQFINYYNLNNINNYKQFNNIIIITNDNDLLQLINNDNIILHNIKTDNIISYYNFKKFTNCNNYEEYLLTRVLIGDKSDNIGRINNKNEVNQIIKKFKNIEEYLEYLKNKNERLYKQVKLNNMLINLYYFQKKFGKYLQQKIQHEEKKFQFNPDKAIEEYLKINNNRHVDKLEKLLA